MMKPSGEIEKLAGRLVLAGFESRELPGDIRRLLERDALLGVILFKRNIESPEQVATLNESVRRAVPAAGTPVIAVDQEGGRVVRLRAPLTVLPPARAFGSLDDVSLTREAGALVGRELSALGFTLDFAPVLDVDTHPNSPVIGDRAFGGSPDTVIRHGLAFAEGLLKGGVMPCAKHFPGHGDAALDSHLSLPTVTCDRARLDAVELAPFRAWCTAALGPVMTAHVMYPVLDEALPATLSRPIVSGVLRGELGFSGPVLTDDLEMGAVADFGGPGGAAVRAVNAGVDGLLVCRSFDHVNAVMEALVRAASEDVQFLEKLEAADKRLTTSLRRTRSMDISYIGSAAHRASAHRVLSAFKGATD